MSQRDEALQQCNRVGVFSAEEMAAINDALNPLVAALRCAREKCGDAQCCKRSRWAIEAVAIILEADVGAVRDAYERYVERSEGRWRD